MGAATNVIPLEVLQEEEAKHLHAPATQLQAMGKVKATGADVDMAHRIIAELRRQSGTLDDGRIRLPRGVTIPEIGQSIYLPIGMQVDANGQIHCNGVPLKESELGSIMLIGGLSVKQLEDQLEDLHQSVSSVARYLKLCGVVATINGHVYRDGGDGKKSSASIKLYLTGTVFTLHAYREAHRQCQMQVGSIPAMRDYYAALAQPGESAQNVCSQFLFSAMKHKVTSIEALVAERNALKNELDVKKEQYVSSLAERDALKEECVIKKAEYASSLAALEQQVESDCNFRDKLISEMAKLSAKLNGSMQAKMLGIACKSATHFDSIADNSVLLEVYRQLIAFSAFTAITA